MITQRSEFLKALQDQNFDVLIIGGGITGAGIALDAAARGLKTILIEKNDFASGTSSKSTKLIHGGLRYLKQFDIQLVKETGKERRIVHYLAPHLVRPEKMLLPIMEGGTFGRLSTSFGLFFYDWIAGVPRSDRRKMLSRHSTLSIEPLLRQSGLKGSGFYAEYRTDDSRLTIEVIKTTMRNGGICLNYMPFLKFIHTNGKVSGCIAKDLIGRVEYEIRAKNVVNAAGPWVDEIRSLDHSIGEKRLFHSKGTHIVVPHVRLPLSHSVYFDTPDKRMVFAIPRHRATYIGTTETPFTGDMNDVFANEEEIQYLLDCANYMFPIVKLKPTDVESTWAGLRPLIFESGKDAGKISRKDEIFVSPSGLISIAGGKLTGYRKMAERVVNLLFLRSFSGKCPPPCPTQHLPLTEPNFANMTDVLIFENKILKDIRSLGLSDYFAAALTESYGAAAERILKNAVNSGIKGLEALVRAELVHCFSLEFTCKPADFLERRTGYLYFNRPSIESIIQIVLEFFRKNSGWNEEQFQQEKQQLLNVIARTSVNSDSV